LQPAQQRPLERQLCLQGADMEVEGSELNLMVLPL
jgi:hypothetical protein